MKCINPIVSTSRNEFIPANSAKKKGGHYTYTDKTKTIYQESDVTRYPCRKCYYCLQARAKEWTVRCTLEAREHKQNCILTLTYENSPRELTEKHMQDFLKRLRKKVDPLKIRYFYVGEYGTLHKRPHYHMIIFGWVPDDVEFWQEINGINYYTSKFINDTWTHGYVTIDINPKEDGIAYTTGYVMTKVFASTPKGLRQPYQRMSNRPGIGYKWYDENKENIYDDGIYVNGHKKSVPKYFDNKYKDEIGELEWDYIREKRMQMIDNDTELGHAETQSQNLIKIKNLLQKTMDKRAKL